MPHNEALEDNSTVMRLRTRKDYERAFTLVRKATNGWDPYGLISGGCPQDEWELEIASIVAQMPRIRASRDVAHVVSRVFSGSLGKERCSPEACAAVGSQLYDALIEARILD